MDMKKALVKASGQKFTIQDKKVTIDAIKVRYNGIINAVQRSAMQDIPEIPDFPISYRTDCPKYKAILNKTQRARFEKALAIVDALCQEHDKVIEAARRVRSAMREKSYELQRTLEAERDELIFQVSLLGSSDAANSIIASLRSADSIANEITKNGLEVTAEAIKITGIGFPSPKQIGDGKEF